jgi:hypothetical protein
VDEIPIIMGYFKYLMDLHPLEFVDNPNRLVSSALSMAVKRECIGLNGGAVCKNKVWAGHMRCTHHEKQKVELDS